MKNLWPLILSLMLGWIGLFASTRLLAAETKPEARTIDSKSLPIAPKRYDEVDHLSKTIFSSVSGVDPREGDPQNAVKTNVATKDGKDNKSNKEKLDPKNTSKVTSNGGKKGEPARQPAAATKGKSASSAKGKPQAKTSAKTAPKRKAASVPKKKKD